MTEPRDRQPWTRATERRVTAAVIVALGALVVLVVLAWWRLRG
jgi:hypothetical protein